MSNSGNKVILVIPGEASSELLQKWISTGELPNLAKLASRGVSGSIESPEPLISAQLWGTMLTGFNPGVHGMFDFMQRGSDGRFRETVSQDCSIPNLWQHAENAGLTAGVINVPYTYPPRPVNGFVIAGQDAPGAHRSIAKPARLYQEVVSRHGTYPVKSIFPGGRSKEDYLWLVDWECDQWVKILGTLAESQQWDLLVCYTGSTAMTQHYFWGDMIDEDESNEYRHIVKSSFEGLDRLVGKLMQVSDDSATVFVVSECGAGPLQSGVDVNAFLAREGYLTFRQTHVKSGGLSRRSWHASVRYFVQSRVPDKLKTHLLRLMRPLKGWLINSYDDGDIDWSRTRAYSRGEEGQIFINLKGRDSRGIVNQGAEYEQLRDDIAHSLLELCDPQTGEKAVTDVHKSEVTYHGPHAHLAADLVVHWRDGVYMPHEGDHSTDEVFGERWREGMSWPTTGSHRKNASFVAAGPMIKQNAQLNSAKLADVTPTILYCLGVDQPDQLEGRVLDEILANSQTRG